MAKPHGSVRIGPISLFALIIILCLAVLAVLSLSTSIAELKITERQAQTTTETYQLETVGQTFASEVDAALVDGTLDTLLPTWGITLLTPVSADAAPSQGAGQGTNAPGTAAEAGTNDAVGVPETIEDEGETIADEGFGGDDSLAVVRDSLVTCSGIFEDGLITATFSMESGRQLLCALRINADDTYTIEQWKVTTQWIDDGTGETLWLG